MKVEINVDETQFKDILDKELQDLPKEVLQNIIVESIKGYFQQDDYKNVEQIFLHEEKSSYGWSSHNEPNELLISVLKNCDYYQLQEVVDEAINTLKEEHYNILKDILKDMFIKGLTTNYAFQSSLELAINDVLCRRANQ